MKHYEFQKDFRLLYDKTCTLFASGRRSPESIFSSSEKEFLSANGLNPQALFDYAEDQAACGEPGFDVALGIETVRRDYFLNVQKGVPSSVVLDEASLPAKTDSLRGIEWLPRILPKARAKLRGELPSSLMYCCGGDRRFFKTHDLNPVEFLALIWRADTDDAVVDWVVRRSSAVRK